MDKTQKEKIREHLEANFLDGDKINDCGGVTFSVDGALDIAEYFYDLAIKETEERMVREIKEKNAPEIEKVNTYIAGKQGEWCICGAWKQYGVNDNHHCTGYRVTC